MSGKRRNKMTAKDIMSVMTHTDDMQSIPSVEAAMPVVDVLPRLLDSPQHRLAVSDINGEKIGIIDSDSLLEGLGTIIVPRDDSSLVTLECSPSDYSASHIARAVEDADTHLVDLWSAPAPEGHIRVMLRVRTLDPTSVAHSLSRYGYEVVETSSESNVDVLVAAERLLQLQTILNV